MAAPSTFPLTAITLNLEAPDKTTESKIKVNLLKDNVVVLPHQG